MKIMTCFLGHKWGKWVIDSHTEGPVGYFKDGNRVEAGRYVLLMQHRLCERCLLAETRHAKSQVVL
jgi:hypothetical protein